MTLKVYKKKWNFKITPEPKAKKKDAPKKIYIQPHDFISIMTKSKCTHKIYIDYLRNLRVATAIAPYSTRARMGAPAATLLSWNELTARVNPHSFNSQNLPRHLAELPMLKFLQHKSNIKILGCQVEWKYL